MVGLNERVIQRHVETRKEGLQPKGVTDPRRRRSKYALAHVWRTAVLTLCVMMKSVRSATEYTGDRKGRLFSGIRRTAFSDLLSRLDPREAVGVLHRQVHAEHRRKALRPDGLPIGVIAFDGRTNWTGDEEVNEYCQKSHKDDADKTPYWSYRPVRAVLISSAARLCIHEHPIPADTNDMGVFPDAYGVVRAEFGGSDLFEVASCDAGFCSLANATLVHESDKAYIFGLKGNQPELHQEAQRILLPKADTEAPEACTEWEYEKVGKVQRRLWRTYEMAGWNGWYHLRQVWLVRKVLRRKDGSEEVVEDRFFVTNLPVNRLTAAEVLEVVRRHWCIENDCYWTLDTQWAEDTGWWVRKGNGLLVCGVLRMIAYNIVALLKRVHGKSVDWRKRSWQAIADLIKEYYHMAVMSAAWLPSFV